MDNKIIEAINIKNHRDFINIEGNYGSHQKWLCTYGYKKKFWSDRSCGIAAAGNLAYYLTKNHNKKLYEMNHLSIESFTLFLNEISRFIRARIYGIPSLNHMEEGFIKFASSKGIELRSKKVNANFSKNEVANFIKKGLRDDYPILMITWNSKIKSLRYHWVTITGYFKDANNNNFIITSNWGKRQVFNLDTWLNERGFYKGLIYFE